MDVLIARTVGLLLLLLLFLTFSVLVANPQKTTLHGGQSRLLWSAKQGKKNKLKGWACTLCVCVFSSHPFWTSSSLDVPAGVTQEEGHTGFLIHLPSAVRALIFVARRIQPFLSLVDREVEFCVLTN